MGRIIYTTCGTSLFTANCWKFNSDMKAFSTFESPMREKYQGIYREAVKKYQREKRDLAAEFDTRVWEGNMLKQLPAELASLRVIQRFCDRENPPGPLSKNDKIVLIHADNEDARFCAKVIKEVLRGHNLLGDAGVEELPEIKGLDPARPEEFRNALEVFWTDFVIRLTPSTRSKLYLNLTGGYKAIIMLLSCFAYVSGIGNTHIFYLNEEAGDEVLVLGFDGAKPLGAFSRLVPRYIDPEGVLRGQSLVPLEF